MSLSERPGVAKTGHGQTESILLGLIDELSECHDNREVLRVSTSYARTAFPGYTFYGMLLSDSELHHWQFMAIGNQDVANAPGVKLADLPTDEPIDPILKELGCDVSAAITHDTELQKQFAKEPAEFVLHKGKELDHVASALGFKAGTLMAAPWQRPRGGLGWIMVGYRDETELSDEHKRLFSMFVRVSSRLAIFPEMVHEVARTERLGLSLRRSIVHDLKTPVTVIRGYAQTLLIPGVVDDPQTQRELLTGVIEQADRLLDDLKDILVPLDDAWTPQPEEFDLAVVLQQAIIAERHTERAQNHRIQMEGDADRCNVYVDRRKIRRVLENLISNAVKYSPGPGKTVTINLEFDNDRIKISFADEGIGMTPEQLDRVLNEEGRVFDTLLGIEGSGFGLDSCRRVLEAHRGQLEATSSPGKGSKFTVIFPRRLTI